MPEMWRPIPDFPRYEVSDLGRVRGLKGQLLTPGRSGREGKQYLKVRIGGVDRTIHRLVLEAFVGPCPPGMEACHGNGIRSDNRLENLRWDTPENNAADKAKHGTDAASRTHCRNGHEYTSENTYRTKSGRACRACKRKSAREAARVKASTAEGRAERATYMHDWRRRTGRVDGLGNQYARRTHCGNGHEYTPENTEVRSDGGRRCRACRRKR